MLYRVEYTNPNNITNTTYKFETKRKSEYNDFMKQVREYPGSYRILSDEKVSEAKKAPSMEIKKSNFREVTRTTQGEEGIVLLGTGGDLQEWLKGVSESLKTEAIVNTKSPSKLWKEAYVIQTSGGRNDLVLTFNTKTNFNLGAMAMWRIRFGSCSWLSDYKVNYADQH